MFLNVVVSYCQFLARVFVTSNVVKSGSSYPSLRVLFGLGE